MNTTFPALGLGLLMFAACSSGSGDHSPGVELGGTSGTGAAGGANRAGAGGDAGSSDAGSAGVPQGGDAGSAGSAGESGEGGAAGLEPGTVIPVTPGVCSETAQWSGASTLPTVSTAADERLLSITIDELDIVFLRAGTLYRAHRDAAASAFGAAAAVPVPTGYDPALGASLSADGLTLVLVSSTGQALASVARASRTAAFGTTADAAAFQALNARATQTMERYVSPVLSADGTSLVLGAFMPPPQGGFPEGQVGVSVVYESHWAGGAWTMPDNLSRDLFEGTSAQRPLPTGLSNDRRTLFYFDEKLGKEQARFRDRPDAPLYTVVDLGARNGAIPNQDCSALYYTSNGNVVVDEP